MRWRRRCCASVNSLRLPANGFLFSTEFDADRRAFELVTLAEEIFEIASVAVGDVFGAAAVDDDGRRIRAARMCEAQFRRMAADQRRLIAGIRLFERASEFGRGELASRRRVRAIDRLDQIRRCREPCRAEMSRPARLRRRNRVCATAMPCIARVVFVKPSHLLTAMTSARLDLEHVPDHVASCSETPSCASSITTTTFAAAIDCSVLIDAEFLDASSTRARRRMPAVSISV